MKKTALLSIAALTLAASASAQLPKALYVKSGDTYSKYNFGVAGNMNFKDNGTKLQIPGYGETIDLTKTDWISFDAPINETGLTPSQQKQKMIDIGEEVNKRINLNDNAELIKMADRYLNNVCIQYPEEWEDLYWEDDEEDDDYRRSCVMASRLRSMVKAMASIAKGNVGAARVLKKDGVYIYRMDDFNGIYRIYDEDTDAISWDKEDHHHLYWKKIADADNLELRFSATDGGTYYVVLDHSGSFIDWEEKDAIARIPASITLTLKKDEKELAKAEISLRPDTSARTFDLDLDFTANTIAVNNTLHLDNSKMTDEVTVDIKGERVITATSDVVGWNLTDYDSIKEDIESMEGDEYYDEENGHWYWVDGDEGALLRHLRNATAKVDVLGMLQVQGRTAKLDTWYDNLAEKDDDDDYYWDPFDDDGYDADKNCFYRYYGDKDFIASQADFLSRYSDLYFTYDGKPGMQGFITYGVHEDLDEWEQSGRYIYVKMDGEPQDNYGDYGYYTDPEGNTHWCYYFDWLDVWAYEKYEEFDIPATVFEYDYELMPYLTFPDGTSYEFDENEFFNEKSFSLLIDDYDVIVDTYESIVK